MKKIILLFMILVLNITLVGCNKKGNAKLNAKTERYIKQCYLEWYVTTLRDPSSNPYTIDDIHIKHYFGDFDGIKIAVIEGNRTNNPIESTLDYYSCYIDGQKYNIKKFPEIITVYYENKCYTLQDACEEGLITKEILDQLDCYLIL